jgi:hypothetical protein
MKRAGSHAKKALAIVVFMALITLGMPQLAAPVLAAENADDPCMVSGSQKFVVTFTNISEGSDTPTPFAPGVYVVHEEPNVLFESGQPNLGNGLEALAEDGNPGELLESIVSMMMADDMDGMEEPHMDMAMMMGMSMEEMAAMAMMSMDAAMTMSEEDLNAMLMMGMGMSMDMMQSMSEDDLTAVVTLVKDVVTELTAGMSSAAMMAMVAAGAEMAGAEAMMGMPASDLAAMAVLGVNTITSMSAEELTELMMLGVDMLSMNMVPMEAVVNPVMMGIGAMQGMLLGMSNDDMMAMMMMGLGMVMMEEADSDEDMMDMGNHYAGIFNTPVGMDEPGPLHPGAAYEFTVAASPEHSKLSLAAMFVQSNDWFVSTPAEGVDLFMEDGTPVEGAIAIRLYDAGTEEDEPVGEGANQAPRQSGPDTGPADDDNTVRGVEMMDAADFVEVTVSVCTE